LPLLGEKLELRDYQQHAPLKIERHGYTKFKKGREIKMGKLSKFTHDELTLNYIWPQNAKSNHDKIKYFLVCILLRKFEKTW
jgi:hypothetical protein